MEIKEGNYLAKFIKAENTWEIHYNKNLVAITHENLWKSEHQDEHMEFSSRQAGESLLYTAIELTANFVEALNKESSMIKDDDGHVIDEEKPCEKLGEPLDERGQLIFQINKTIEDLKKLPQNISSNIVASINEHIVKLTLRYASLEKKAYEEEFDKLIISVQKDLKDGIDCLAGLQRLEDIKGILDNEF